MPSIWMISERAYATGMRNGRVSAVSITILSGNALGFAYGTILEYDLVVYTVMESWHLSENSLTTLGSLQLKMSMRLSYDYLRLYVNAFAYQATISRAMSFSKESQSKVPPSIDAATPDARFIYEAIDAAKSLLTRVNEFVGPETLRSMPCTYYLFIIYSAVFLYKVSGSLGYNIHLD